MQYDVECIFNMCQRDDWWLALSATRDQILVEELQYESKNPPPYGFLTFFPNSWEFLINFYTLIIRYYLH